MRELLSINARYTLKDLREYCFDKAGTGLLMLYFSIAKRFENDAALRNRMLSGFMMKISKSRIPMEQTGSCIETSSG